MTDRVITYSTKYTKCCLALRMMDYMKYLLYFVRSMVYMLFCHMNNNAYQKDIDLLI